MKRVLITGGSGFVGAQLVKYLLSIEDHEIVVFDKLEHHIPEDNSDGVKYFKGNILSKEDISKVFKIHGPFLTVYHLASAMPNKEVTDELMWKTNVVGTLNLVKEAINNKTKSFIFTSSNVTYGIPRELPVNEKTPLIPLEMYGKSKKRAEEELIKFRDKINIQIFRCPVITGIGRLGLQAILYEFISENKNVYMLGDGENKYQFADVSDIVIALEKANHIDGFDVYTIGAPEVISLKEIYKRVIKFAGSKSKIVSLPMDPALFVLSILDRVNISPLGIYQYTMMGRSIYADTSKINKKLNWKAQKTNSDTFIDNYKWYIENKGKFTQIGSGDFSANRSVPKMGILKLIKLFS